MTNANNSFEEKIKLLQISFVTDLPDRLNKIELSISELDSNPSNSDELDNLTRALHSLAGSGATFGLPAVTDLAREGESLLKVKQIIEHEIEVSITCGIASYPPAKNSEHLSISADIALYKAKELGRNQVAIFENV